jgi:hypothetical protein
MAGFGVILCVDVYDSFLNVDSTGVAKIPDPTKEKNYGGHGIWAVGYSKEYPYIFHNTWGTKWGKNGIGYLPEGFKINEAWFVVLEFDNDDSDENEPIDIYIGGIYTDTVLGITAACEKTYKNIIHMATQPMFRGQPVKFIRCKDDVIRNQFIIDYPDKLDVSLTIEKNHFVSKLSYKGIGVRNQPLHFVFVDYSNNSIKTNDIISTTNDDGIAEINYTINNNETFVTAGYIPSWRKEKAFASEQLYYDKY